MAISNEERAAIRKEAEERVDRIFLEATGRTWKLDEADLQLAAGLEAAQPKKPPSSVDRTPEQPDSWARIKADFPDVFGT